VISTDGDIFARWRRPYQSMKELTDSGISRPNAAKTAIICEKCSSVLRHIMSYHHSRTANMMLLLVVRSMLS
jgi:hypothetical protein